MGSSPPDEPRRSPTSGRSTSYPFLPPTMQRNSFVSGVTHAVDPSISLANSTPPPSGSLSIQQSPPSASPQRPTLPSFNTVIESIRSPELPLRLCDGRSSHTANPSAGVPSSRPYDPNSVTIQQSPSNGSSLWRQVPTLDFNRPGRLSPPIPKSNMLGDQGLPLPNSHPSNVTRPMVSNTITSNRSMNLGIREGHVIIGTMIPGLRGINVGHAGGHALDLQQQMYENPLAASEDRDHQATLRQQMYGYPHSMARGNNYHPLNLPQRMHSNPESIAGAHRGHPSIAQLQMQSNRQLMARENSGHPANPQEHVRRLSPTPRPVGSRFECDQCLEWHVDMASHRETHLEAKRFTCRYCKKSFMLDGFAASFSFPTEKTLINTFHRRISQPTSATTGIEKTDRCVSIDTNMLFLLKSTSP